jgi:hypothetical protein
VTSRLGSRFRGENENSQTKAWLDIKIITSKCRYFTALLLESKGGKFEFIRTDLENFLAFGMFLFLALSSKRYGSTFCGV